MRPNKVETAVQCFQFAGHGNSIHIILYKFKLSHNTAEAAKNICCAKNEDAVESYSNLMIQEIFLDLQETWWT